MQQNHYRELLDEVRNDVAEAERTIEAARQTIAELASLEQYLERKVKGGGGLKPPKVKGGNSQVPAAQKDESSMSGGGMQTVEFGPDGFPKG